MIIIVYDVSGVHTHKTKNEGVVAIIARAQPSMLSVVSGSQPGSVFVICLGSSLEVQPYFDEYDESVRCPSQRFH